MGHEVTRIRARCQVFLQYARAIISDEGNWERAISQQFWLLQLRAPRRGQLSCADISEKVVMLLNARMDLCEG